MNISRIGNWRGVLNLLRNLKQEMKNAQHESLMNFALKAENIAVTHMSNQDLGWKKLKARTVARKVRLGYSENILIESSTYFQSITSWVHGNAAYVGVKRGVYEADGVTEVANIAAIHEYGSKDGSIPKRPLWKPTLDEAIQWHIANNLPTAILIRNLKKYLRP